MIGCLNLITIYSTPEEGAGEPFTQAWTRQVCHARTRTSTKVRRGAEPCRSRAAGTRPCGPEEGHTRVQRTRRHANATGHTAGVLLWHSGSHGVCVCVWKGFGHVHVKQHPHGCSVCTGTGGLAHAGTPQLGQPPRLWACREPTPAPVWGYTTHLTPHWHTHGHRHKLVPPCHRWGSCAGVQGSPPVRAAILQNLCSSLQERECDLSPPPAY